MDTFSIPDNITPFSLRNGCLETTTTGSPLPVDAITTTMGRMIDIQRESLCHDPIHGYIPFISIVDEGETSERTLLDHPWLQRLRQIHQLQTAWWDW